MLYALWKVVRMLYKATYFRLFRKKLQRKAMVDLENNSFFEVAPQVYIAF